LNAGLYILCGGRSSRFGSDKGLYPFQGQPLVCRAAGQFSRLFSRERVIIISSDREGYGRLGFEVIPDLRPGRLGPLAGLEAAARHALGRFPLFFVTSCDRFGLQDRWLLELATALERSGAQAAAYFEQYWQPFPAVFRPQLADWISRLLDQGESRPAVLLDKVAIRLPPPPGWKLVRDINRQQQLGEIP